MEEPSPDRREPLADPFCGGCLYGHIAYPRQLESRAQVIGDAFARIGRVPFRPLFRSRRRRRTVSHARPAARPRPPTRVLPGRDARRVRRAADAAAPAGDVRCARRLAAMRPLASTRFVKSSSPRTSTRRTAWSCSTPFGLEHGRVERLAATEGLTGLTSASAGHGAPHVVDRLTLHDVAWRCAGTCWLFSRATVICSASCRARRRAGPAAEDAISMRASDCSP